VKTNIQPYSLFFSERYNGTTLILVLQTILQILQKLSELTTLYGAFLEYKATTKLINKYHKAGWWPQKHLQINHNCLLPNPYPFIIHTHLPILLDAIYTM
jgi:hypothetical protein